MSKISFALYVAHENGVSYDELANKLNLPLTWVTERVESVRLCLRVCSGPRAVLAEVSRCH